MADCGIDQLTVLFASDKIARRGPTLPLDTNPRHMKTSISKIGVTLVALGIGLVSPTGRGQTTTVTTTRGAFTEFVPGSQTVIVKSGAGSPLRYVVTRQTTIVDESGVPVTVERISPGSPLAIQYIDNDGQLVASRIVVQPQLTTMPVVTDQKTTTTTVTNRPLTHDEKEALKEQRERQKKQLEEQKKALEKAKDKLDDDDDH